MNIDLFRKIDRYLGVSVCALFSLANSIAKPFKSKKEKPIKKILFLQISELGSSILARPSIQYLQEKHPDAEIYYLIFDEMKSAIEMLDLIPKENIITIRSKSFSLLTKDTLKAISRIRKLKIDAVIDLELFARFSAALSYLTKARIKVGFNKFHMEGLYRGSFYTHKVLYNHNQHISLSFLSLVQAIEAPENELPLLKKSLKNYPIKEFRIPTTEDKKKQMWQKLKNINPEINEKKKIVILNPNASALLPLRKWPLENYCIFAKQLLQDKNVFLVITGVESEKLDAEAICNYVKDKRCLDLAGKTTLRELIELYYISNVLVSNDSGPPQFASLTPIKIFVFFGPETPKLYSAISKNLTVLYSSFSCSPCVSAYNHRKSPCNDNKCLQAIKPDFVYKLVKEALNNP